MLVQFDPEVGATYVRLSDREVARTVVVGGLVTVDLDEHGVPVGIEFPVTPCKVTDRMIAHVAERFPGLALSLTDHATWNEVGAHRPAGGVRKVAMP